MEWNKIFIVIKGGQWCAYNVDTGKYIKNVNKEERNLVKLHGCKIIEE